MNAVWWENTPAWVLIPAYLHPVAQNKQVWRFQSEVLAGLLVWEGQSSSTRIEVLNQSASSVCRYKVHSDTFLNKKKKEKKKA